MSTNPKMDALLALRSLHTAAVSLAAYEDGAGPGDPDVNAAREIAADASGELAHELATFLISRPFPWAKGVLFDGVIYEPRNVEGEGVAHVHTMLADSDEGRAFGRVVDIVNDPDEVDEGWAALDAAKAEADAIDQEGEGWKTGRADDWNGGDQ